MILPTEASVAYPAKNAMFGDTPNGPIEQGYRGYLLGNAGLNIPYTTTFQSRGSIAGRHNEGTNLTFFDGHSKWFKGKTLLGYGLAKLTGEEYSWSDAGKDFASGAISDGVFATGAKLFSAGAKLYKAHRAARAATAASRGTAAASRFSSVLAPAKNVANFTATKLGKLVNCFPAGTLVVVVEPSRVGRAKSERSSRPSRAETTPGWETHSLAIERIRAGQQVVSRDPVTGQTRVRRVVRTFVNTASALVQVELAEAGTGRVVEVLRGTPGHPFFTSQGLALLGDLGVGTQVVTRAGPPLVVQSVTRESHPSGVRVYNLEVEGDHTYFVGTAHGGTWVHNISVRYTAHSRHHVFTRGHAANSPRIPGQSRFRPTEGGQKFADEVVNHPSAVRVVQSNGRISYTVHDLGRMVGYDRFGNPTRGGRVIVEGATPASWSVHAPDEVVTQFPF